MSPESAPLHGGRPPKPSPFPLFALAVLAGGAFAANAQWQAEPTWAAPAACSAGVGASLLVFWLGSRLFGSRRAGFMAALTLVVLVASRWCPPPFLLLHLKLLLNVPVALSFGWALNLSRDGRLGRGGDLAARVSLGVSGALLALAPFGVLFANSLVLSNPSWVAMGCLAASGAVVTGMSVAGTLTRWPTPEAVLVLAAGFVTWTGLVVG